METDEPLRLVMRRVYTHYANRMTTSDDPDDTYVSLSDAEKTLLSGVDWLQVLGVRQIPFKVQASAVVLNYDLGDEPVLGFVVSRTIASHRLRIPLQLGPLTLIGVLWKGPEAVTVATGTPTTIIKQTLQPVKNLAVHLNSNETRSTLVLYARQSSGVIPFPVENFTGVGRLHLVMQLNELRRWLWPSAVYMGPECAAGPVPLPVWPEAPNPDMSQWLLSHPLISLLWAGKIPGDNLEEPVLKVFQTVRSQSELEDLVRAYDDGAAGLSPHERKSVV